MQDLRRTLLKFENTNVCEAVVKLFFGIDHFPIEKVSMGATATGCINQDLPSARSVQIKTILFYRVGSLLISIIVVNSANCP